MLRIAVASLNSVRIGEGLLIPSRRRATSKLLQKPRQPASFWSSLIMTALGVCLFTLNPQPKSGAPLMIPVNPVDIGAVIRLI